VSENPEAWGRFIDAVCHATVLATYVRKVSIDVSFQSWPIRHAHKYDGLAAFVQRLLGPMRLTREALTQGSSE
jgi:hypothetical protein